MENGEGILLQMYLICPKLGYFSTHPTNPEFSVVPGAVNLVCFLGTYIKDCISLQAFECVVCVGSQTLAAGQGVTSLGRDRCQLCHRGRLSKCMLVRFFT